MNKRTPNKPARPVRPNLKKAPAGNRKKKAASHTWPQLNGTWRPLMVIGAVVLTSLFFLGAHKIVTGCDLFNLQTIKVTGNCLLAPETIIKNARIAPGANILAVNLAAVRKNVLSNYWIDDAEVTREMPGTIVIAVTEYAPLAIIDMGTAFLMDSQERLFKPLEDVSRQPAVRSTLPVISGLDYSDLGADGKPGSAVFKAALAVVKTGQAVEHLVPGMHIREVVADPENGIAVRAFDDIDNIYLGFDDYFLKFKRLKKILHDWDKTGQKQHIAAINFESSGRAVLQPAREGS